MADLFGDSDHGDPNASTMHDDVTGPNATQSALIGAGTDAVAAAQFVARMNIWCPACDDFHGNVRSGQFCYRGQQ